MVNINYKRLQVHCNEKSQSVENSNLNTIGSITAQQIFKVCCVFLFCPPFCEKSAILPLPKCSKGKARRCERVTIASTASEYPLAIFPYFQVPCPKMKNACWDIPNPYKKRRRFMANRKRNIQMKFWVTEEEKRLTPEKMKQLPTKRYGAVP